MIALTNSVCTFAASAKSDEFVSRGKEKPKGNKINVEQPAELQQARAYTLCTWE